jgi:hypothetical protein
MEHIIYLVFALLAILIIAVTAFRNAKPTTINHGTIHHHHYGKDIEERPKPIIDENVLFVARNLGEILREFRGNEKSNQPSENRTLSE